MTHSPDEASQLSASPEPLLKLERIDQNDCVTTEMRAFD